MINNTEGSQGRILTLYHTTSQDSALHILAGKRFYRGSGGNFGGGIYFALTADESKRRALSKGVTIKAKVHVGKSLVFNGSIGTMTYTDLVRKHGCESVKGDWGGGVVEYVVYNCSQVRDIEHVDGLTDKKVCSDPSCARYKAEHFGRCGDLCSNPKCKMYKKKHLAKCKDRANHIIFS